MWQRFKDYLLGTKHEQDGSEALTPPPYTEVTELHETLDEYRQHTHDQSEASIAESLDIPLFSTGETSTNEGATTMSTIRETVNAALINSGYESYTSYAGPVIEDLEQREENIAQALRTHGVEAGASADAVEAILVAVGLAQPPVAEEPEVEASAEGDGGLADQVAALTRQVDALTQAAARAGVRV